MTDQLQLPNFYNFGWQPLQDQYGTDTGGFNRELFGSNPPPGNPSRSTADSPQTNWNWGDVFNTGTSLMNAYTGWQQLQNARAGLAENKRQFNMNWEAQKNLTNSQLEARRNRQIAAQGVNSGNGMTAEEYVAKYGVR